MKTISLEIPDGYKAEFINGILTLIEEKSIKHKFNVGDKVIYKNDNKCYIVKNNSNELYEISRENYSVRTYEENLELYKDITEQIKTFNDAVKWCIKNNKKDLCDQFLSIAQIGLQKFKDISAYFKLRIITAALNEGWEPTFKENECRYYPTYTVTQTSFIYPQWWYNQNNTYMPYCLYFKTAKLACYASKQFANIYADFYGIKK